MALPQTGALPFTEAGWHELAREAAIWLSQKSKTKQPIAMFEMWEWVRHSGVDWGAWCHLLQSVSEQNSNLDHTASEQTQELILPAAISGPTISGTGLFAQMTNQVPLTDPVSCQKSGMCDDSLSSALHRAAKAARAARKLEAEEMERRRRRRAEREAKEETYKAKAEGWMAKDTLLAECRDQWRQNMRKYTKSATGL
jgi:hypothetical protein